MARVRVVVAMSGGVDSSVAAALLQEQGHEVVGITLHLYDSGPERRVGRCCAAADQEDARAVAARLGIAHYTLDYRQRFEEAVVRDFVETYAAGETPTPCTHCNTSVKFGPLLEAAAGLGASALATGHYVRLERSADGLMRLRRGRDAGKDQSYFLFTLSQDVLARTMFPLGDWTKDEVRAYARRRGLATADKADSMEVCFVEGHTVGDFVASRRPAATRPGPITDGAGRPLGTHGGVHRFTIGQRRGLPVVGDGRPRYVLALDASTGTVVVGTDEELLRDRLEARDVSWLPGVAPEGPVPVSVQIRHRGAPEEATVTVAPGGRATVQFARPVRAIAPGQAAVFYAGDELLGGGWIARPSDEARQAGGAGSMRKSATTA
jgi:tRNA-uridine 2-sulfurtransferase